MDNDEKDQQDTGKKTRLHDEQVSGSI